MAALLSVLVWLNSSIVEAPFKNASVISYGKLSLGKTRGKLSKFLFNSGIIIEKTRSAIGTATFVCTILFLLPEHSSHFQDKEAWYPIRENLSAIDHWINDTYDKYGVNLPHFCWEYIQEYLKHPSEWPKETKEKNVDIYNSYLEDMRTKGRSIWTEEFLWHYNYRKTLDPFNISGLYRRMSKKPFTRGRKEQFQYLILYYATDWFDDDSFWEEYSSKFN